MAARALEAKRRVMSVVILNCILAVDVVVENVGMTCLDFMSDTEIDLDDVV